MSILSVGTEVSGGSLLTTETSSGFMEVDTDSDNSHLATRRLCNWT